MAQEVDRKLPRHVAIIMDGNGRWAKARGLPRSAGHNAGVEAVRRAVRAAAKMGIEHLTIYAFSTENWVRPQAEVALLMNLLKRFIRSDVRKLKKENVKIVIIGEREDLDPALITLLEYAERETAHCTGLTLSVAFNYGGRQEIASAAKYIAEKVSRGELRAEDVDAACVEHHLHTGKHSIPDVDLLIRTSGEERISNFLLWQCAYAEFVFVPEYWPDFTGEILQRAIDTYYRRDRRYGNVKNGNGSQHPIELATAP